MTALASTYEKLTLHQQIAPEDGAVQGWPLHFPDGSAPLSADSTAVASHDWYGFRDPNELIYVNWVAGVHDAESDLAGHLERFAAALSSHAVSADWLGDGAASVLAVLPYTDRAYFRVLSRAQRLALSDTVTLPLVFDAADKLRHVEHAAAHRAAIENTFTPTLFDDVGELWAHSGGWLPLRLAIEELLATDDWVEALLATNLVIEPLVGRWIREHYVRPIALTHGDNFAPAIIDVWSADLNRSRAWTFALIDYLAADPTYGPDNSDVIAGWAHRWEHLARAAATSLAPLLDDISRAETQQAESWRTVVEQYDAEVAGRWRTQLLTPAGER
ncbi:ferritin family protein [Mycolicibacterium helvum]|uniref:propane 2-monooxygenase n=1 Tax=Mycolicibacterium helvum TaxID=1534349 RepID=A0A7I7T3T9_9MYCO|nr:hypothetical protein [Mycolicibacterium helvum]BBY63630.1 toluene hydroxylase [Mycolicibacterium helvum]